MLDKQIDAANKIVTDLLDFTRIKPPSKSKVDLSILMKESLSYITVPENITIKNTVNGHSPQVVTDGEQMGRVFTNIISNAIQAMSGPGAAKPGELDIDTGADSDSVWIRFKDTGCGISEENIQKIFEPLFTTKPKGIGLGLAISKRLVEQNGGAIEVASRVGEGATFTVKLPAEKRRGDPLMKDEPTILIVDDNEDLAETFAMILKRRGFSVETAGNGTSAVDKFKEQTYDVTLMDIVMPEMNGVEAFKKIKEMQPGAPVILMTAYSDEELIQTARDEGVHQIIHKPIHVEQLIKLITEAASSQPILIIDDDTDIRETLTQVLKLQGHEVLTAGSGEEAVEIAERA